MALKAHILLDQTPHPQCWRNVMVEVALQVALDETFLSAAQQGGRLTKPQVFTRPTSSPKSALLNNGLLAKSTMWQLGRKELHSTATGSVKKQTSLEVQHSQAKETHASLTNIHHWPHLHSSTIATSRRNCLPSLSYASESYPFNGLYINI